MKMNKKVIIGIALAFLLIAALGFTYAYFTANIEGNEDAKDVIVEAGTLSLHFEDGPELVLNKAFPGDYVEKEFKVTNTGTLDTNYTIWWKELVNEILYDELVLTLECTSTKDGSPDGTCEGMEEIPVETNNTYPIKSSIAIDSGITHTYKLRITFKEMNKDQNYNQGKRFYGVINIREYFENETDVPKSLLYYWRYKCPF